MMITLFFSAAVGFLSGYFYALFAYRSYVSLWQGKFSSTFFRRFGFLAFRMAVLSAVMGAVFTTHWCSIEWFSGGLITGYIGFYLLYGVMKWM